MKKSLLVLFLSVMGINLSHAQNFNINLLSNLPYTTPPGNSDLANIGGYVDPLGKEYALVGWEQGLSIVDVSNPANPFEVLNVPGPQSIWREVKTYLNYAYVTTEGGDGLQIIDLSQLPTAAPAILWTGDAAIAGQIDNIHSLHIEDGYVYLHGTNLFGGAALICDIATNPLAPHYVGHTPGQYVHDGFAKGNTYYGCHVYNGDFTIYDVTNKANPIPLGIQTTPTAFTHNCWTDSSGTHLFTTDENTGSFLASYDVSNPTNITELDRIQITPGSGSIVHNTHIVQKVGGEFAVSSWYHDGVVITDVTRPQNMVNVGWYDTYPQGNGDGFDGDWGVYPFLPSGNLIVSDINNGLFVLGPDYVRACYLEGLITDSVSTLPLNNATVQIIATNASKITKIDGLYKTGFRTPGTYDVQVSRAGYITKTITGIALSSGVVTALDVQLVPVGQSVTLTGSVVESTTNIAIPNAIINFTSPNFTYNTISDASGSFNIPSFFTGTYDVVAGHWGHRTQCFNTGVNGTTSPLTISLDKGYYDDFSLDFGWTAGNAPHDWERGVPVGTTSQGQTANPDQDVQTDCLNLAYVTGNGGGGPADNDVDPTDGTVTLVSPVFDLTSYTVPQVQYYRWFFDGALNGNNPNDTMLVKLSNGLTTVTLETILPGTAGNGTWLPKNWNVASFITPTANMQLSVETSDANPGSVVEGGLDKFEVVETVGINSLNTENNSIQVYPNPFNNTFDLKYLFSKNSNDAISVTDLAGKELLHFSLTGVSGTVSIGKNLDNGVYFVNLLQGSSTLKTIKVIKTK